MIGIKYELQEQLQYKSFIKCIKIDVSAAICSNFNSYLTVMSSICIPHQQLIIYKSYANHISLLYKHMLLVTAISVLQDLILSLSYKSTYINLFQSQ